MLDGWEESRGVQDVIRLATTLDINVEYMEFVQQEKVLHWKLANAPSELSSGELLKASKTGDLPLDHTGRGHHLRSRLPEAAFVEQWKAAT